MNWCHPLFGPAYSWPFGTRNDKNSQKQPECSTFSKGRSDKGDLNRRKMTIIAIIVIQICIYQIISVEEWYWCRICTRSIISWSVTIEKLCLNGEYCHPNETYCQVVDLLHCNGISRCYCLQTIQTTRLVWKSNYFCTTQCICVETDICAGWLIFLKNAFIKRLNLYEENKPLFYSLDGELMNKNYPAHIFTISMYLCAWKFTKLLLYYKTLLL